MWFPLCVFVCVCVIHSSSNGLALAVVEDCVVVASCVACRHASVVYGEPSVCETYRSSVPAADCRMLAYVGRTRRPDVVQLY